MDDDPNARSGDPHTSKQAGRDIRAEKAADRAQVYATFHGHHPIPLADFQMEEMLGGAKNGKWRKRRSDLTDEGVLIPFDTITNPHTNKEVIRWALRDASQPLKPKQRKPRTPRPVPQPSLLTQMGVSESEWTNAIAEERRKGE
jgi:hypothetical protein